MGLGARLVVTFSGGGGGLCVWRSPFHAGGRGGGG